MHRLSIAPDRASPERRAEIALAVGRSRRSLVPGELTFFFSREVDALAAAWRLAPLGLDGSRVVIDCYLMTSSRCPAGACARNRRSESTRTMRAPDERSMTGLAGLIRRRAAAIIADWEQAVRVLPSAAKLPAPVLEDDLPNVLQRIASFAERFAHGEPAEPSPESREHALDRLRRGFDLEEVVGEYAALRECVLRRWASETGREGPFAEVRLLDRAVDASVAAACAQYVEARERTQRALDRISTVALDSATLEETLHRLLDIFLELTPTADTAVILMREGDRLRVRAAVGLEEEVGGGVSLRVGEGFAGRVAAERRVIALRDASAHPIVRSRALRAHEIRALLGVPLLNGDELVGVAHLGSLRVDEFSAHDTATFETLARRATAVIHLHLTRELAEARAEALRRSEQRLAQEQGERERLLAETARREGVQRFLAATSAKLAQSIDPNVTIASIGRMIVPEIADGVVLLELGADGMKAVAVSHRAPESEVVLRELFARPEAPHIVRPGLVEEILRSGRARVVRSLEDELAVAHPRDREHLARLRRLAPRALLITPLVARGRHLGALELLLTEPGRAFDEVTVELVEDFAGRVALALDNARLYEAAQEATRQRDDMLAVVSHDLRTPLSTIVAMADLLTRSPADSKRPEARAEVIHRSAMRMERLIRDLLDVASMRAGRLALERRPCGARALLADATQALQRSADEKGVHLDATALGELPLVDCDESRIQQVLGNLLRNAIEVTPSGGRVTLSAEPAGAWVRFRVTDTGPGIAEKDVARLFEPYRRGDRPGYAGTGLGLTIAKGIVDAHHGRIEVESRPGGGASFSFCLPGAAAASARAS